MFHSLPHQSSEQYLEHYCVFSMIEDDSVHVFPWNEVTEIENTNNLTTTIATSTNSNQRDFHIVKSTETSVTANVSPSLRQRRSRLATYMKLCGSDYAGLLLSMDNPNPGDDGFDCMDCKNKEPVAVGCTTVFNNTHNENTIDDGTPVGIAIPKNRKVSSNGNSNSIRRYFNYRKRTRTWKNTKILLLNHNNDERSLEICNMKNQFNLPTRVVS